MSETPKPPDEESGHDAKPAAEPAAGDHGKKHKEKAGGHAKKHGEAQKPPRENLLQTTIDKAFSKSYNLIKHWVKSSVKGVFSGMWSATGGAVADAGRRIGYHGKRAGSKIAETWRHGKETVKKEKNIAKIPAAVQAGVGTVLEVAASPVELAKTVVTAPFAAITRISRGIRDAVFGVVGLYPKYGGANAGGQAPAEGARAAHA